MQRRAVAQTELRACSGVELELDCSDVKKSYPLSKSAKEDLQLSKVFCIGIFLELEMPSTSLRVPEISLCSMTREQACLRTPGVLWLPKMLFCSTYGRNLHGIRVRGTNVRPCSKALKEYA